MLLGQRLLRKRSASWPSWRRWQLSHWKMPSLLSGRNLSKTSRAGQRFSRSSRTLSLWKVLQLQQNNSTLPFWNWRSSSTTPCLQTMLSRWSMLRSSQRKRPRWMRTWALRGHPRCYLTPKFVNHFCCTLLQCIKRVYHYSNPSSHILFLFVKSYVCILHFSEPGLWKALNYQLTSILASWSDATLACFEGESVIDRGNDTCGQNHRWLLTKQFLCAVHCSHKTWQHNITTTIRLDYIWWFW